MRTLVAGVLLVAMTLCGCSSRKPVSSGGAPGAFANTDNLIVTPENPLVGRVIKVDFSARFVVLNFPVGRMPQIGAKLSVYREGLKVGELSVTGPQREDNTVADVIAGEVAVDDVVREP